MSEALTHNVVYLRSAASLAASTAQRPDIALRALLSSLRLDALWAAELADDPDLSRRDRARLRRLRGRLEREVAALTHRTGRP